MELLIILAVAGGLIWLLSRGSKKTEVTHPPTSEENHEAQTHTDDQ